MNLDLALAKWISRRISWTIWANSLRICTACWSLSCKQPCKFFALKLREAMVIITNSLVCQERSPVWPTHFFLTKNVLSVFSVPGCRLHLQGWGLLQMLKLCLILPGEQAGPLAEQFALTYPARLPATLPYWSVPRQGRDAQHLADIRSHKDRSWWQWWQGRNECFAENKIK